MPPINNVLTAFLGPGKICYRIRYIASTPVKDDAPDENAFYKNA